MKNTATKWIYLKKHYLGRAFNNFQWLYFYIDLYWINFLIYFELRNSQNFHEWIPAIFKQNTHCVKSAQIRSYFWSVFSPNTVKYGPEITLYLDPFTTNFWIAVCDWLKIEEYDGLQLRFLKTNWRV